MPLLADILKNKESDAVYKVLTTGEDVSQIVQQTKKKCQIRLDTNCLSLYLFRGNGKKPTVSIDISQLREVREGFLTQGLLQAREKLALEDEHVLSLVVQERASSLVTVYDFHFDNQLIREWWLSALRTLVSAMSDFAGEVYTYFKPWLSHLRPHKATMSVKSLLRLLASLNFRVSKDELESMVRLFDVERQDGRLNFCEFVSLMRKNRSYPIISYLFATYSSDDKMNVSQLIDFFAKEQKQALKPEEAAILVSKFTMGRTALDEQAFQMMLTSSDDNRAMEPAREQLHHDMSKSLHEYFIDSSHNTYCSGDQLKSESSIEMYVRAFTAGCRCVELDLWDGPNGEAIVYHGRTLTSKITFVDILRVVKSHGFKTSPYPIVLSFENHCSIEVCDRMAYWLKEILGDMLATPESVAGQAFVNMLGQEALLSPERLKHRVLVKATAVVETSEELNSFYEECYEEEERAEAKNHAPKRDKLSAALTALVYLKATRLHKFSDANFWQPVQMCSFSEPRTWKIFERGDAGMDELSDFTSRNIARIYPRGTRFDSSNFDPILPWVAGCQMVALNYQTPGAAMYVNEAKFRENGHAGYNLRRPEYLPNALIAGARRTGRSLGEGIDKLTRPPSAVTRLRVKLYGARMLPPSVQGSTTGLHFTVQLLDGAPSDATKLKKTDMVQNWFSADVTFEHEFPILDSYNSYLLVCAVVGSETIAHYCCGVELLRPGFRSLSMLDEQGFKIEKGMCIMLAHFEMIKDVEPSKQERLLGGGAAAAIAASHANLTPLAASGPAPLPQAEDPRMRMLAYQNKRKAELRSQGMPFGEMMSVISKEWRELEGIGKKTSGEESPDFVPADFVDDPFGSSGGKRAPKEEDAFLPKDAPPDDPFGPPKKRDPPKEDAFLPKDAPPDDPFGPPKKREPSADSATPRADGGTPRADGGTPRADSAAPKSPHGATDSPRTAEGSDARKRMLAYQAKRKSELRLQGLPFGEMMSIISKEWRELEGHGGKRTSGFSAPKEEDAFLPKDAPPDDPFGPPKKRDPPKEDAFLPKDAPPDDPFGPPKKRDPPKEDAFLPKDAPPDDPFGPPKKRDAAADSAQTAAEAHPADRTAGSSAPDGSAATIPLE